MSTGFSQFADIMEFVAPTGGVTKGVPVLIGGLFVIPADTAIATVTFRGKVAGAFVVTKATSETWAQEQPLFWDSANARATVDGSVGFPLGTVAVAALSADTTGTVRLHGNPLSGRILTYRKRLPIATINAGATLLPAIPGAKYRLIDAYAIAVGGAVTSNTTVDLKGTQAASAVKLVAFTQASLTQSAMVRAGGAGGTLLADGASFAQCDANAALTIANTGSAITVATSVDVAFSYTLE